MESGYRQHSSTRSAHLLTPESRQLELRHIAFENLSNGGDVCDAMAMSSSRSQQPLDFRKWFDRMQPQTLQIATWLLYLNGFFALIGFLGTNDWIGVARSSKGFLGVIVGLLVIAGYILGGFLMANDRRLGYRLALIGAFSPFALRIWILWSYDLGWFDMITGKNLIGFLFDVALCALLLHSQSREHQRLWYS